MQKVDEETIEAIKDWLDGKKLVGDIEGAIYYISYDDEKELDRILHGEKETDVEEQD